MAFEKHFWKEEFDFESLKLRFLQLFHLEGDASFTHTEQKQSRREELKVMIFLSCKKLQLVPLGDWKEEPGYSVTKTDRGSSPYLS